MTDEQRTARMKELEGLITQARHDYYNGEAKVTDAVFDAWVEELEDLDAVNSVILAVGAPVVSEWAKVKHAIPMGSLNKVNTPEEMAEWISTYADKEAVLTTEKLDGISLQVKYVDGKLVQAATRGDGLVGEDITINVLKMKGIPEFLPKKITAEFRGEVILLKSDFAKYFQDKANTRNAASGTAKRYDGKGCEHLTVIFYKVLGLDFATEEEQLKFISSLNLKTPWWTTSKTPQEVWVEYQREKRERLDYEIDGLVVVINDRDRQFALGEKDLRPKGSVAFKFAPETRETTLRGITWQTGGTGRITPVAQFDPVTLVGAKVENASVYNVKYITDLGMDIGAKILVSRANDVIPRVEAVTQATGTVASAPVACPVCSAPTARDGEYLVCTAPDTCRAQQIGRLNQWIKSLEILEWGDVVLEKLVLGELAKSVPDLYRLTEAQLADLDRMGVKSATKLVSNLHAKKTLPLETLLGSLSIPGVATSTIKFVIDAGYDSLDKIRTVTLDKLTKVNGLGPVKAKALHTWLSKNGKLLDDLLGVGVTPQERVRGKLTGLSFCFTGEMVNKRGDLENMVKDRGGEIKSSVTKKLSYLVLADTTTTKAASAKKFNIKCLSEEEFLTLIQD
jgi:DNA ligase (NAD+)